jgi:hypothetical protein
VAVAVELFLEVQMVVLAVVAESVVLMMDSQAQQAQ